MSRSTALVILIKSI